MEQVLESFEERVKEIDLFFDHVKRLYQPDVTLCSVGETGASPLRLDPGFLKILKASAFLILYNMVESAVREGILHIYSEMEADGLHYQNVSDKIREIWIDYHYRNVFDLNSNWSSYRKAAARLIDDIINHTVLKLDRRAIDVSGNLDADQVRRICEKHGIRVRAHPGAKGGVSLETVKKQRNLLAHGTLSFTECGRQFSIEDLEEIKNQTMIFIRSILNGIDNYVQGKHFAMSPPA